VNAEHAPEGRLVTPNPWATLGSHVVASPASHGALEGGGGSRAASVTFQSNTAWLSVFLPCQAAA